MEIKNLKIEMLHNIYDPEGSVYYTEGIIITFKERRWDRKIVIHDDEYSDSNVIGMKLFEFSAENVAFLRELLKKEIYKRLAKSFKEHADYYDPDISNVMEDISALRKLYDNLGYLRVCYPRWYEKEDD